MWKVGDLEFPENKWEFPNKGAIESEEKLYYHLMTKKDIEERLAKNDIIFIPVGSTENHGNGGPVGEDTLIVTRIAEMVCRKVGATIFSPIWCGSHPFHHIGQAFTIPIPDQYFIDFLRSIMTGLWNTGYRKMIFMSLHGQEYSLPVAIQEWGKKYQVPAMVYFVDFPRIMGETLMDKKHGGPYDRPFQHACEAEQSISLALFPEFCDPENAENTETGGLLPPGHIDRGGDIYGNPIPGHCVIGNASIECVSHPEGVLGHARDADASKARDSVRKVCDYLMQLHSDILKTCPVGQLPDPQKFSMRDPAELEALIKGVRNGGRHIYTLGWPC
ncbi:MAG: creatininase family protein [Treponema sp.]|jgi:creatinine amidohydrolase|nr:creatininase family protein [Treponema sp.]